MNLTEAAAVLQLIDVENISKLDDLPNDVGGLSAAELKATFDKAGVDLKQFLADLIQAIIDGDEAAARGITQIGVPGSMIQDGTITAEKLMALAGAEAVYTDNMRDGAVTEAKLAVELAKKINDAVFGVSGNTSNIRTILANLSTLQTSVNSLSTNKQDKHITRQVSLAAGNTSWSLTVSGVTATNTIFTAPDPASRKIAAKAGVYLSAQAQNRLVFSADKAPTAAVTMNICIFN